MLKGGEAQYSYYYNIMIVITDAVLFKSTTALVG